MFFSRIYPALCLAVGNFVIDRTEATGNHQDYFVSFVDVTTRFNVRELTTAKIGELVRISGQVVRTHPVHPELLAGHFTCQDCQTDVPNVEQQFKVSLLVYIIYLPIKKKNTKTLMYHLNVTKI